MVLVELLREPEPKAIFDKGGMASRVTLAMLDVPVRLPIALSR